MSIHTTSSPIDDIAYLARSDHRISTLVALTERPRSRPELSEMAGVSSSTIRRTLGEFEARNWVRKEGYQFAATQLGEVVASGMEELIARVETERQLRDVWDWLPDEVTEFTIEAWADLTVTIAVPDCPYRPVSRFESLLRETDTCRYLRPEIGLMEPCLDALFELLEEGADITVVDRPGCHEYFFATYPEQTRSMVSRDNFTVLEHEDLPAYGVGLLDERVAISCFEATSGTIQALVDTEVPAVREWAESIYRAFEDEANPVAAQPTVG